MRMLWLLILLLGFTSVAGWAQTYSCRDSGGKVHYSDNLQGLPEECWGQEEVVKPGNADNLNFVPDSKPEISDIEFEHSVRAATREQGQREGHGQQLRHRAEVLRDQYQQELTEKWQAKTGWSNNKRKHVKVANDKLIKVLERKQKLLSELKTAKIPTEDKDEIQKILAELDEDINAE